MKKTLLAVSLLALVVAPAAAEEYTAQPGGEPPPELAPEIAALLVTPGTKIMSSGGEEFCEIWLRKSVSEGPDSSEIDVSWTTVPHGTLMGALQFPSQGVDRRGQQIGAGVYTLRFSYYPVDGAHQGVEATRDFLMLSPAGVDKDPAATPDFDELMAMSRQASSTQHPAGLVIWKAGSSWKEGFAEMGEDWVLSTKIGDATVSIVMVGINEHDR